MEEPGRRASWDHAREEEAWSQRTIGAPWGQHQSQKGAMLGRVKIQASQQGQGGPEMPSPHRQGSPRSAVLYLPWPLSSAEDPPEEELPTQGPSQNTPEELYNKYRRRSQMA